jgi:xylulokinase
MTTANAPVGSVTVGIDIGTSSVKAVAADDDGNVIRRARVPHEFAIPTPDRFQHDARVAWFDGPRAALGALGLDDAGIAPKAVSVAAMVPSLTAVDEQEQPIGPGLLYGDERGRGTEEGPFSERGELGRFLASLVEAHPDAAGFRTAQSVANASLTGDAVMSTTAAGACWPLFDFVGWSEELVTVTGARVEQMPKLVPSGQPAGEVRGHPGCVLEGGTIDAMGEQIVAGAYEPGDVLVICGTTLIVWSVVDEPLDIPGYFPIPHTTPGRFLIGGPSNAGGLFLNWATSLLADAGESGNLDVTNVPLWVPYPRGERVPINDPTRRAELHGLDLTHTAASLRRAAFEAAGFVTRRFIEITPKPARRIVATGGGVAVADWLDALATCTGLPVDVVAVPEGAALGAAFGARLAAGLETSLADGARWARKARTVEPDAAALDVVSERYERWLTVAS